MDDKSIVGDLINFRGLVYSPINENGVIFLFGKVMEDLNMYIEEIKPGFPDCIGRRFTGKGWEEVKIEFEYKSSNFQSHKHDPKNCDIVVCWEHDWTGCPIEVLELKEIIKSLPNPPIKRPDSPVKKLGTKGIDKEITVETHLKKYPEKTKRLFELLNSRIKTISEEIWRKVGTTPVCSYYSPERSFIYVNFQKQGLRIILFTRGQKIEGVKGLNYEKAGAKWGRTYLKNEGDLEKVLSAIKKSRMLIREAIKKNEPTGWYAELEEREDGSEEQ